MNPTEIRITHIGEATVKSVREVMLSAFVVADEYDLQVFRANTHLKWHELDNFGIEKAIIYGDEVVETWIRHPTHWDVAITKFTIVVPIEN